jgi:hypothetical protein
MAGIARTNFSWARWSQFATTSSFSPAGPFFLSSCRPSSCQFRFEDRKLEVSGNPQVLAGYDVTTILRGLHRPSRSPPDGSCGYFRRIPKFFQSP